MKVIAVFNIKGGVGKTSTAVNLAYLSAQSGLRTLVWDLDPQGASSFYFRVKPKIKGGSTELISGKRELEQLIKGTDFDNLDLLPADFSFRNLDLILDEKKNPEQRLKKLLKPLANDYDLVFLDCPPSISLLSEAVFSAADLLLSPIIPTTLSLRTLEQLQKFLTDRDKDKPALLPFFSMVDRRKKMHADIVATPPQSCPTLLDTVIPYASDVERMGTERAPLGTFGKNSRSQQAYQSLWHEIRQHLARTG